MFYSLWGSFFLFRQKPVVENDENTGTSESLATSGSSTLTESGAALIPSGSSESLANSGSPAPLKTEEALESSENVINTENLVTVPNTGETNGINPTNDPTVANDTNSNGNGANSGNRAGLLMPNHLTQTLVAALICVLIQLF